MTSPEPRPRAARPRVRRALPTVRVFVRHLLRNVLLIAVFVAISLTLGASGYHWLVGLAWLDAYLNASMILTGMGPLAPLGTSGAKVFGIFYSLFSALAFLTVAAVLFGPLAHRMLHRFHLDVYGAEDEEEPDTRPDSQRDPKQGGTSR
jgi:hypothetical protein